MKVGGGASPPLGITIVAVLLTAGLVSATYGRERVRADGAVLLYAPAAPASAQNPLFLEDAATLVFTQFHRGYNRGPAGLFGLRAGTVRPLLDEPGSDSVNLPGSAYRRSDKRIAFGSDRLDGEEIWTMAASGGELRRVTRHGGQARFREPSWSPDGRWIVFERSDPAEGEGSGQSEEDSARGSIWKVRADGTALTQLSTGYDDRQPNWSPRGDRIVFQRRRPGHQRWQLCTLNASGQEVQAVTDGQQQDTDPSWSPDGRMIVYASDRGSLPAANLFVVTARGGSPHRLTHCATREDAAPCWSPDGKWIAFESHPAREDGDAPASLWRIAAR